LERSAYEVFVGKSEGKGPQEGINIDGRINWILKK
jgi:hypothetical protein